MLQIFLVIFGLIGLIKGDFQITRKRRVDSSTGRFLGILLLIGAIIPLFIGPGRTGLLVMVGVLVLVIVIGLAKSHKTG